MLRSLERKVLQLQAAESPYLKTYKDVFVSVGILLAMKYLMGNVRRVATVEPDN